METIEIALFWNSIFVAILAIVVLCLSRMIAFRNRPALRHALWLLVLAKLIIPSIIHVPLLPLSVRSVASHSNDGNLPFPSITKPSQRPSENDPLMSRAEKVETTPMLWASPFRPVIIVPKGLLNQLSRKQIAAVIAHEVAHFARMDHWSIVFASSMVAIFWWNPIVWLARCQLRRAQEECCDALVVGNGTVQRRLYAETLLAIVDFQANKQIVIPVVSPGIGETFSLLRRFEMLRIDSIHYHLSFPAKLLTFVFAATLPCLPTWSSETQQGTATPVTGAVKPDAQDVNSPVKDAWSEYLINPFSEDALRKTLPNLCRDADEKFGEWYISGVFEIVRKNAESLFAIEIYDGNRNAFRLGMVAIVTSKGEFVQSLEKVRILSSMLSEDGYESVQLREEKILRLDDLNGDGFSELPTERWDSNAQHTSSTGSTILVYSPQQDFLKLVFQIHFPHNYGGNSNDVNFFGWLLARNTDAHNGMAIKARLFVPFDIQEHKEQWEKIRKQMVEWSRIVEEKEKVASPNRQVLKYSFQEPKRVIDETQPHRVMASFNWSEEKQTFVGPKRGPQGAWTVILSD